MTTNQHIKDTGAKLSLSAVNMAVLQQMWDNRNVGESILLNEAGASKDYSRRDFKVVIMFNNQFKDVTKLVADVTGDKYNNGAVEFNGGNSNAPIELLSSLFLQLTPEGHDESVIKMQAATQPWML